MSGGGGPGGHYGSMPYIYAYQPPPVSPYYVQSPHPQYMMPPMGHPPQMPAYSYGMPPTPVTMGGYPSPAPVGMRRAGSINAKIMSQVRNLVSFDQVFN